jgi:predicted permease
MTRKQSRLYRLMLRLLPRSLREEFGDDMVRLFGDRYQEAGDSWRERARTWTRGAGDLLRHAIAERWRPRQPSYRSPRRGNSTMERCITDVRHALRGLRQAPAFAGAAILTLALGIGATAAIFTAINGALLQPLPFARPDRLVRVWPQMNFNKALARRVADASPALEATSGMSGWLFTLTGEGDPQQVSGVLVSWNHFDLLGVQPALGRGFTRDDGLPGQADVVILSHPLWVEAFGADPAVIGRRIRLAAGDYQTRRVVGVMPEGFQPLDPSYELWAPLDVDATLSVRDDDSWYVNVVVGRLADETTVEQATAQVRALASSLNAQWPERFEDQDVAGATVEPLQAYMVRDLRDTLWTLLAAVGAVLLISCVNVANLLLARGNRRQRDLAMRAALGATRARLLSQQLTESLILGIGGCLAGLLLARSALWVMSRSAPSDFHRVADAAIDPGVLAFALGVSVVAILLFGLLPAWRAAASVERSGLGRSTRGIAGGDSRLSGALVVAEVALAVVLVIGAGLMLRSLWKLYRDDPGFDGRGVLSLRIGIPEGRFEQAAIPSHYGRIWEAVEAVPGVEQAGGIHLLPLTNSNWNFPYSAEDNPVPDGTPPHNANHRVVTPGYFATLRIPLLRGRTFTDRDTTTSEPVGMINQRMARELWPDDDPVGKEITVFGSTFTVVGVVGDVHQHGIRREVAPEMYRPHAQWPIGGLFVLIRTSGDPAALAPSVRRAIWSVDPEAPINDVRPMEEVFGQSVAGDRFVSLLIAAFGALALGLGAVGVYGVTAYSTGRRHREFGVRMAVGADRSTIMRHALGTGVRPALAGIGVGLAVAWWGTRLLAGLLYGVETYDVVTFTSVPAALVVVATLACALPAWRASRLDPVTVLRQE